MLAAKGVYLCCLFLLAHGPQLCASVSQCAYFKPSYTSMMAETESTVTLNFTLINNCQNNHVKSIAVSANNADSQENLVCLIIYNGGGCATTASCTCNSHSRVNSVQRIPNPPGEMWKLSGELMKGDKILQKEVKVSVRCAEFQTSFTSMSVRNSRNVTLGFKVVSKCHNRKGRLQTVSVSAKRAGPGSSQETICTIQYSSGSCGQVSGCTCDPSSNVYLVSRLVGGQYDEKWTLVAETQHKQYFFEKEVKIHVIGSLSEITTDVIYTSSDVNLPDNTSSTETDGFGFLELNAIGLVVLFVFVAAIGVCVYKKRRGRTDDPGTRVHFRSVSRDTQEIQASGRRDYYAMIRSSKQQPAQQRGPTPSTSDGRTTGYLHLTDTCPRNAAAAAARSTAGGADDGLNYEDIVGGATNFRNDEESIYENY